MHFKWRSHYKTEHSITSCTCQKKHAAEVMQRDTEESVLSGEPESAVCVRKFDDSLSSAIRKTYRSLLRSSSLWEPRYPLLRVVQGLFFFHSRKPIPSKRRADISKSEKPRMDKSSVVSSPSFSPSTGVLKNKVFMNWVVNPWMRG